MRKSFYEVCRPCFVYLLLSDAVDETPEYYVGYTFSAAISKVYSRHIHSGYVTTKNTFSVDAQPNLYILQDRPLTGADAYRFVVAYTKFFEEQKLGACLNYDGTMWQAEFIKPETEVIYQEISTEPLEGLLRRTYVVRAIDADRERKTSKKGEQRIVQLNVSVTEADKTLFDTYCKQLGVSRREAFEILLNTATNKTCAHYENVIKSKEAKIEKQTQEIKTMQQKLALATGQALPKRELWASAMVPFMLDGIKQYLRLLFSKREVTQPIKSRPYKGFIRTLAPDEEYTYPEKEGFYLVRLETVLWGSNKSCFYVGACLDGKYYKFRYYSKEWFVGIPPRGSGYEEQYSPWLLGCKRAADGAMDLIAAFPLPNARLYDPTQKDKGNTKSEKTKKPSLADRLVNIERQGS